jgi:restriction system protein
VFLTKLIEDAPPYILSPRTDIIAERDGKRIVVQCKFYSKPVGNKAVQEAAARLHGRADKAIVVSNAAYTKAARQLAGTTGVILLHHDDLDSFGGT